jgi:hypothetical protein
MNADQRRLRRSRIGVHLRLTLTYALKRDSQPQIDLPPDSSMQRANQLAEIGRIYVGDRIREHGSIEQVISVSA